MQHSRLGHRRDHSLPWTLGRHSLRTTRPTNWRKIRNPSALEHLDQSDFRYCFRHNESTDAFILITSKPRTPNSRTMQPSTFDDVVPNFITHRCQMDLSDRCSTDQTHLSQNRTKSSHQRTLGNKTNRLFFIPTPSATVFDLLPRTFLSVFPFTV